MAHPGTTRDSDDTGAASEREPITTTPLWVKVFGIIALIVVVLFVIVMLTGRGGQHGPGRHTSSADAGVRQP